MKNRRSSLISLGWTALILVGGCFSQEKMSQNIQHNRQVRHNALVQLSSEPNDPSVPQVINEKLTLVRSVELAMKHNKDIQVAQAKLAEAEGQLTEAISTALPEVTFSSSALAHDNETQPIDFNGQKISIDSPKETYQWKFFARQPLYLGGLTEAAIDAAVAYAYRTQQEVRQATQTAERQVRQKYLAALLAQELEVVARQAQKDAQENHRLVKVKFDNGQALKFEVLRAQVRLQATDADVIKRRNEYAVAIAGLLNEIGISQKSQMAPADDLLYEPIGVDGDACLELAMLKRPDLLAGEANIRLYNDSIKSAQSENRPKLYLQGAYQEDKPGGAFGGNNEWQRTMNGGLALEWKFFDGFRTNGAVAKARAQLHQQEISLRRQEELAQFQVTEALLTLQNSAEFVASQSGNVENAQEALRLAQINFREGTGTSLDVINAETSLSQARSDYINAVYVHQLSQLGLTAAMGILGEMPLPLMGVMKVEGKVP